MPAYALREKHIVAKITRFVRSGARFAGTRRSNPIVRQLFPKRVAIDTEHRSGVQLIALCL
ncbi:MAG: hypothetical protein RIS11_1857, partial [Pseudomonadota bacterium]